MTSETYRFSREFFFNAEAMEAGIVDRACSLEEIAALLG